MQTRVDEQITNWIPAHKNISSDFMNEFKWNVDHQPLNTINEQITNWISAQKNNWVTIQYEIYTMNTTRVEATTSALETPATKLLIAPFCNYNTRHNSLDDHN